MSRYLDPARPNTYSQGIWKTRVYLEYLEKNATLRILTPQKLLFLGTRTPAVQVQTLPLQGPCCFLWYNYNHCSLQWNWQYLTSKNLFCWCHLRRWHPSPYSKDPFCPKKTTGAFAYSVGSTQFEAVPARGAGLWILLCWGFCTAASWSENHLPSVNGSSSYWNLSFSCVRKTRNKCIVP